MRHASWVGALVLLGVVVAVAVAGDLDDTPEWMRPLTTSHGVEREAAIHALAQRPDRLTDCLTALDGEYAMVHKAAVAEAVARMNLSPQDVTQAATLLKDSRMPVRSAGLRILGAHASSARQTLAAVASDADEAVALRAMASRALGGAGSAALADLRALLRAEQTPDAVRLAVVQALAQVSETGMGDAATLAQDSKARRVEREVALQAIGAQGASAVPTLQGLAQAQEAWVRASALAALQTASTSEGTAAFASALTDTSAPVRLAGLRGLVSRNAHGAKRTAVMKLLVDPDVRVKMLATRCVGATCLDIKSTVIPTLKTLLASPTFAVRREAALALLALQDKGGQATMLADSASTNPAQATQAALAHTQIKNASW